MEEGHIRGTLVDVTFESELIVLRLTNGGKISAHKLLSGPTAQTAYSTNRIFA